MNMSLEMATLHNLAHISMMIVILVLLGLHLQLHDRCEELQRSCSTTQRTARESPDLENRCVGEAENKNDISCFQNEDSSLATPPVVLKVYPRPPSELTANRDETHSRTQIVAYKPGSVSISESSFDSRHAPFETSGSLTVDEFGRTGKAASQVEASFTDSSTDINFSQISHVEITKIEVYERLESEDKHKNGVIAPTMEALLFQPSSTIEGRTKKHDNAYSLYNDKQHTEDVTMTKSHLSSDSEMAVSSSVTRFGSISLSISETSEGVDHSVAYQLISEKQNFGETLSDASIDLEMLQDSTIITTENVSHDYLHDYECRSESCRNDYKIEHSILNIQPVSPSILSYDRTSSNANTVDEGNISNLFRQAGADDIKKLVSKGTSARCEPLHNSGSHSCHFENLCYKVAEHDFIFLKGEQSVIKRSPMFHTVNNLDLFDVNLSTVQDHNALKFSPVFIPASGLDRFSSVAVLQRKSFILHRFKPDNIMHVLHDDILPLYHTLHSLHFIHDHKKSDITVLFTDNFDTSDYNVFYKSLSTVTPASLRDLNLTADILCFTDVYLGLLDSTLWYQYGFFKPQGPLKVNNLNLLTDIQGAVKYVMKHVNAKCMFCTDRNYLTLLSRKDNRQILNEGELMMSIARATKLKVVSVSLETHSVSEIVSIVRNSMGIIGMHGSLLSFVIFLQPGSVVIELFPYAVSPQKYAPFKSFCDLLGSKIIYKSWANPDKDKSVAHPDWPAEMGGVHHLSHDTQAVIINQSEVPEHLCCEDPSWLYHIYQDTFVDIVTVTSLTVAALAEANSLQINSKSVTKLAEDIQMTPGPVIGLTCKTVTQVNEFSVKYLLMWKLPWNLGFLQYENLEFELVITEYDNESSNKIHLPSDVTSYYLEPAEQRTYAIINVWIRVTVNESLSGPYTFISCKSGL